MMCRKLLRHSRAFRMQILELVLNLLARLLRDLGALNLVLNLVPAGSPVSADHWPKSS